MTIFQTRAATRTTRTSSRLPRQRRWSAPVVHWRKWPPQKEFHMALLQRNLRSIFDYILTTHNVPSAFLLFTHFRPSSILPPLGNDYSSNFFFCFPVVPPSLSMIQYRPTVYSHFPFCNHIPTLTQNQIRHSQFEGNKNSINHTIKLCFNLRLEVKGIKLDFLSSSIFRYSFFPLVFLVNSLLVCTFSNADFMCPYQVKKRVLSCKDYK